MSTVDQDSDGSVSTKKRLRNRFGFVVGVLLLLGAAVYLASDPEHLRDLITQIKQAPKWAGVIVVVGPIVNWICIGLCLHALVRRHGKVGRGEMLALVGSAWLLNHL